MNTMIQTWTSSRQRCSSADTANITDKASGPSGPEMLGTKGHIIMHQTFFTNRRMNRWCWLLICNMVASIPAWSATIPGLFNTGVDDAGAPLADNESDPHYRLVSGSAVTGPAIVATSAGLWPIEPFGPWLGDNTTSAWITPSSNTEGPNAPGGVANYWYETHFDLTGMDPATAIISGFWATDNGGIDILINGAGTGHANMQQYTNFTAFQIDSGFVSGTNRLTFVLNNGAGEPAVNGPTGLRVEMTGMAEPAPVNFAARLHYPLGQAMLVPQGDTLTVANFGPSGQDGVGIVARGDKGLDLHWQPPASFPDGAWLRADGWAGINGVQQLSSTATANGVGNGIELQANFPLATDGPKVVELYRGNILLAAVTNGANDKVAFLPFEGGMPLNRDLHFDWVFNPGCRCWLPVVRFTWSPCLRCDGFPVKVQVPALGELFVDEIRVRPLEPFPPQDPILTQPGFVGFELTGANLERLVLDGEANRTIWAGQEHVQLGNALVGAEPTRLYIANLGPSGQDGVSINLADPVYPTCHPVLCPLCCGRPAGSGGVDVHWKQLDNVPPGAWLSAEASGLIHGIEQVVGTATAMRAGSNIVLTADFPLANAPVTLELYATNRLVTTLTNVAADNLGYVTFNDGWGFPTGFRVDYVWDWSCRCFRLTLTITWGPCLVCDWQPAQLSVPGHGQFAVDKMVVRPQEPSLPQDPVPTFTKLDLKGANLGPVIVDRETVRPAQAGPSLSMTWQDGQLAVSWLGSNFMLQAAENVTGPWEDFSHGISLDGVHYQVIIQPGGPRKFYRLRDHTGGLSIPSDKLGIVPAADVPLQAIEAALQLYGLVLVQSHPGNIHVFGLAEPQNPKALQDLAWQIELAYPGLLAQIGLVAIPPGAAVPMLLTDEFVVQFHPNVPRAQIDAINVANEVLVLQENPFVQNQFLAQVSERSTVATMDMVLRYGQTEGVEYAEPNFVIARDMRAVPNDPLFNFQWHLQETGLFGGTMDADIDAELAWDITTGNGNVVIAVIDSGFDVGHPDLVPNLWGNAGEIPRNGRDDDGNSFVDDVHGWNVFDNNNDLAGEAHGTAVAGCVGAKGNNLLGVSGSCQNCRLMLVRISGRVGTPFSDGEAFDYARAMGAEIITCSWGYPVNTPLPTTVVNAINQAALNGRGNRGCVIFFAMNNTNVNDCGAMPDISSLPNVIAVSRSNNRDRFDFSGFGNCMDVLAPSFCPQASAACSRMASGTVGITTTDILGAGGFVTGDYTFGFNGTSAATPITAGIAGLMLSVNPNLSRLDVQRLLQDTCDKIEDSRGAYGTTTGFSAPTDGNATHGFGRVNAFEAVRVAAPFANGGRGGVDIFLRDNRLDWGNTEQPSSVLFEPARDFIPYWESVDIKVDAPPFRAPPTTSAQFDVFPEESPIANTVNRVYVRVHNRGPRSASGVAVKLHWAFAGTALPALPADFWTQFPADSTDASKWHPLGVRSVSALGYSGASVAGSAADQSSIVQFDFPAPVIDPNATDPRHHCLLAIVDCADDPILPRSRNTFVVDFITPRDNNVTLRNYQLQDSGRSVEERIFVRNPYGVPIETVFKAVAPTNWLVTLDPLELSKPYFFGPGEEHLVTVRIQASDDGQPGSVAIIQERVSEEADRVMGGFTFEFALPGR